MDKMTVDLDDCGLVLNGERVFGLEVEAVVEVEYDERGAYYGECRQLKITVPYKSKDRPDLTATIEVDDFDKATRDAIKDVVEPVFTEMLRDGGDGR